MNLRESTLLSLYFARVRIALKIASTGGEANTNPATAPDAIPLPTNPIGWKNDK